MDECTTSTLNFLLLSTLITIVIAKDLDQNEQLLLSSFLQTIGQNLASMISVYDICDGLKNSSTDNGTTILQP